MKNKIIKYSQEAREKIKKGVDTVSDVVKVTLGPKGRNVLLTSSYGGFHVTKDGVSIAKEIFLKDQFEDKGVQLVKQAAQKTCDDAGDGTTSCTVLAQEIYNEGLQYLIAGKNPIALKRGMDKAVASIVEKLEQSTRPVSTDKEIIQVGTISSNDPELGKIIAEVMDKTGKDGIVSIEESKSLETTIQISDGLEFDRGYVTPYFINNMEKTISEFDNALVLLIDGRMENVNDFVPILESVSKASKQVLIIAEDYGEQMLSVLVSNRLKGSLHCCPVKAPGFGERRKEILKDLSVLTGATLFSKEIGNDITKAELSDLGSARKIVVSRKTTKIIDGAGDKEDVKARINQIRDDIKNMETEYDKEKARERLAKLSGGAGVISVGGATESEMKEKKDRIEDAVHATRASLEEGIVPGGGVALARCVPVVEELIKTLNEEEGIGASIIAKALSAPLRQIAKNSGDKPDVVLEKVLENKDFSYGYDAATGEYVNMLEAGIVDPKKVVRCALQNAASVASMLITTEAIVCFDPDDPSNEE